MLLFFTGASSIENSAVAVGLQTSLIPNTNFELQPKCRPVIHEPSSSNLCLIVCSLHWRCATMEEALYNEVVASSNQEGEAAAVNTQNAAVSTMNSACSAAESDSTRITDPGWQAPSWPLFLTRKRFLSQVHLKVSSISLGALSMLPAMTSPPLSQGIPKLLDRYYQTADSASNMPLTNGASPQPDEALFELVPPRY